MADKAKTLRMTEKRRQTLRYLEHHHRETHGTWVSHYPIRSMLDLETMGYVEPRAFDKHEWRITRAGLDYLAQLAAPAPATPAEPNDHSGRMGAELTSAEAERAWEGYPVSELELRRNIMDEINTLLYDAQGNPGTRVFNQSSLVEDVQTIINQRDEARAQLQAARQALAERDAEIARLRGLLEDAGYVWRSV
jgi:hypothetical protein